jgi:hypothetical protein
MSFGDRSYVFSAHHHTGHAERDGISEENLGEALRDDRTDAEAVEGLWSVFARAATAEIRAGEENTCPLEACVIERVRLAIGLCKGTGIVEGEFAQSIEGDALHEASWDDTIGVEVIARHINAASANLARFFLKPFL